MNISNALCCSQTSGTICHWDGLCVNFVGYQLTWRTSQLPRVKKTINSWDTFASAAFDHRVWVLLNVVMLGVADGETGYSWQILMVILPSWCLYCAFSFLNGAQIKSLYFPSFSVPTNIVILHHQSSFPEGSTDKGQFGPSYSWQIPVERNPKIRRELGIWCLGLSKIAFHSSSVILSLITHNHPEKMSYVTRLLPLSFVLLTHLPFHGLQLLRILCLSKGWSTMDSFLLQDTCSCF